MTRKPTKKKTPTATPAPTNDKIPYSEDEIDYILRHIGPGPEHQSWGRIAYNLNKIFESHNKGKRCRQAVYRFATEYTREYAAVMSSIKL